MEQSINESALFLSPNFCFAFHPAIQCNYASSTPRSLVKARRHALPRYAAHALALAKDMKLTAYTLPDGTTVPLVHVENWDFNWQTGYELKTPLKLPAGSHVDLEAHYDKFRRESYKPKQSAKVVTWGEQTKPTKCASRFLSFTLDREHLGEKESLCMDNDLGRAPQKTASLRAITHTAGDGVIVDDLHRGDPACPVFDSIPGLRLSIPRKSPRTLSPHRRPRSGRARFGSLRLSRLGDAHHHRHSSSISACIEILTRPAAHSTGIALRSHTQNPTMKALDLTRTFHLTIGAPMLTPKAAILPISDASVEIARIRRNIFLEAFKIKTRNFLNSFLVPD